MDRSALKLVDVSRRAVSETAARAGFPHGLAETGLHEVCPHTYNDGGAALGFTLAACLRARPGGALVWIGLKASARDEGRLSARGLEALGLSPGRVLQVSASKPKEALWATQEAIDSGAAGLVVAEVPGADFTATRRLALACEARGTPVILLMSHRREGASAAQGRWRVSAAPSAPNRWHGRAPGTLRWQVCLERSRLAPQAASRTFLTEFDHETACLHLVSGLGPGSLSPPRREVEGDRALRAAG